MVTATLEIEMGMNHLSRRDTYRLTEFVREHYQASKLNDVQFAAKAKTELGLPVCSSSHISGAREALDMPANLKPRGSIIAHDQTVLARLTALEQGLADMHTRYMNLGHRLDKVEAVTKELI